MMKHTIAELRIVDRRKGRVGARRIDAEQRFAKPCRITGKHHHLRKATGHGLIEGSHAGLCSKRSSAGAVAHGGESGVVNAHAALLPEGPVDGEDSGTGRSWGMAVGKRVKEGVG